MRAGTLNRRVLIERAITVRNPSGQVKTVGWEPVAVVWAHMRVANGKEHIASGVEISEVKVSFRIRWRTDVVPEMRVVHAGTKYEIEAILPDFSRREHIDLVTVAGKRKA